MERILKAIDAYKIKQGFVLLFVFMLVMNIRIVNIALISLLLIALINYKGSVSLIHTLYSKNKIFVHAVLFMIIYQLFIAGIHGDLGEKRIGLLFLSVLVPLALYLVNDLVMVLKSYLLSLLIVILLGVNNLYNYYLTSDEFVLTVGGHIDSILVVARPFLGYMLALGGFVSVYLFQVNTRYKGFYLVLPFVFIFYLIFIGNRMQVLSLFFILVLYIVFYLRISWLYKLGGCLTGCLLLFALLNYNDTMKTRFELQSFKSNNIIESLSHKEPRIEIWNCAFLITQEETFSPIKGVGKVSVLEDKMEDCYNTKLNDNPMKEYFTDSLFDTHNQFIEYYVLSGILGVVSLLSLFSILFLQTRRYFLPLSILVLLFNFCFVENLLDTQLGTYLFGFSVFIIITFLSNKKVANDYDESSSCRLVR